MMTELSQIISQIEPVDPAWLARAQERLDSLTKPPGSLGRLEELAARYVAIRGELLAAPGKEAGGGLCRGPRGGGRRGERLSPGGHLSDGL